MNTGYSFSLIFSFIYLHLFSSLPFRVSLVSAKVPK